MANVFSKFMNHTDKPSRNTEDLSFTNNFSTQFGRLIPVFCREVNPGDSVSINPSFGLNFTPMLYPVQTKMKAHLHFFYVRNRSLWKDWMDYITKAKDNLTPPYINFDVNPQLLEESGLGDYFNLPTSFIRPAFDDIVNLPVLDGLPNLDTNSTRAYTLSPYHIALDFEDKTTWVGYGEAAVQYYINNTYVGNKPRPTEGPQDRYSLGFRSVAGFMKWYFNGARTLGDSSVITDYYAQFLENTGDYLSDEAAQIRARAMMIPLSLATFTQSEIPENYDDILVSPELELLLSTFGNRTKEFSARIVGFQAFDDEGYLIDTCYVGQDMNVSNNKGSILLDTNVRNFFKRVRYSDDPIDITVIGLFVVGDTIDEGRTYTYSQNNLDSPFYSLLPTTPDNPNVVKVAFGYEDDQLEQITPVIASRLFSPEVQPISALPFRAYEAIYNSFYRNPQNNPFMLNGQPEYNRFVTNIDGGEDNTIYKMYNRNWDDDMFTTAVQSPQQGVAPLVGVTSSGEFTFRDDDGEYTAQAIFGDDGETITNIEVTDANMPIANRRALVDLVSSGISINDFRNVNALQRWLEKNVRKMRYKDQMESHFGANVRYDELLMPEFLGGTTQEVDVNRVINTSAQGETPLGAYGGLAQAFGGNKYPIKHYADEHGFIIGILSVVPYSVYSQCLPRMFTRFDALDYFFPEFNGIGMQPIYYRDIAPLQLAAQIVDKDSLRNALTQTFGYNRPWPEYISTLDEAHGRYRSDCRNYIFQRLFKGIPALNDDFLTVDALDLNNVWAVKPKADNEGNPTETEEQMLNTDKILGLIHFDFKYKSSVSEYGIPYIK